MPNFDESHQPVPSVDFDFDKVERVLGNLDGEGEVLSHVVEGAEVAARYYALIIDGLESTRRPYRNTIFRIRFELILYFLGRHPDQSLPLCALADKLGFRRHTVTDEAARIRAKLSLPARLSNNAGVRT